MDEGIRRVLTLGATALLSSMSLAAGSASAQDLFGFTNTDSGKQLSLEQRFDAAIDPAELNAWEKRMSAEANNVGTPYDKANAEFVRDQFKAWGWDARIEVFYPLYPTLKSHTLELVAPTHFVAKLHEPPIPGDATSARTDGMDPYLVYAADGDVTGELVYVNYGMPDDYAELARRGVDVRGKIAITRYGDGWRGLKPKLAQEHGAIGCIIYSDPADDGYAKGDPYPKGGWRPADGVQRGSVADMPVYPGDPLTPGVGATKNAKRLAIADAKAIMKIPAIPISYADAQPLLAAMSGPVAPPKWRGALPITYHIGGGAAKVHLAVSSDWGQKPLYDVVARIKGSEYPDEWVVRGNHRDGWVMGAGDPLSGHTAMLAEAKAIGTLLKSGWHPKRTLIYTSWDGEEPGLLGSTEWAETHAAELQQHAVLYLNSDGNGRGFLRAAGSHSLQKFTNDVASTIKDPETGVSTRDRLRAEMEVGGYDKGASEARKQEAKEAAQGGDLPIEALGSGSDFTPFLQHLGITTLALSYGGEGDQAGVYHSLYDSYDHYVRFGDPGFVYGVLEAKTVGHTILRMVDAQVLPLQFGEFAGTVRQYLNELHALADQKRKNAQELSKLLDNKAFELTSDPTRPVLPPQREKEVPQLDFAPLDSVMSRLKSSAQAYDELYAKVASGSAKLGKGQAKQLDDLLRGMESMLTNPQGLPGRDWYKHLIYAPGLHTGYGVKTVPGVREALEESQWDAVATYVHLTADALTAYCDRLDKATALLRQAT